MSRKISCRISDSLWVALHEEAARNGSSMSHVVQHALSSALGIEHHSLFQVSTTGAIVKGVFQGSTTVEELKNNGDFGLGTFDGLDGEMIMLDGHCFQARAGGEITDAEDAWLVPFASVTRFSADRTETLTSIESQHSLEQKLDRLRPSHNIFVGLRLDGFFSSISLRAACKALPGEGLVAATSHQSEFSFENIRGSLVGFWTPSYAKTINVPGYHLHFISSDRTKGGHVLDLQAAELAVGLHFETDLHLAIPETEAFLRTDLTDDPSGALDIAEKGFVKDR